MGTVTTRKFVRKPLFVQAVQVTEENFKDIAEWSNGEIRTKETQGAVSSDTELDPANHYIHIRVNNPKSVRQSQAFVGDWVLFTERGFKIYTDKPFKDGFDEVFVTQTNVPGRKVDENLPPELSPEEEAKTH